MTIRTPTLDLTAAEFLGHGMTNLDGTIADGMADALRAHPGAYCQHSAWNFCGRVYWWAGRYHEQVWRYGNIVDDMSADTLEDLMRKVNDVYGYD